MRPFLALFLLLGISHALRLPAAEFAPFKDGETVCFVGDSITHAGGYLNTLRKLLALRAPGMSVRLVNCGVSGDTLMNVLRRFDNDIAVNRPNCAVVMMGMNDNSPRQYTAQDTPQQRETKIATVAGKYQQNLQALAGKMKALPGCRVMLLAPTPFDEWQNCTTPNNPGCDQGLQKLAELCADFAEKNGWGYLDLHSRFGTLLRQMQTRTPPVNLISNDRIHPNASGQIRMGMLIFSQWIVATGTAQKPPHAAIAADTAQSVAESCTVSALKATRSAVEFTLSSSFYPVIPDARAGADKELLAAYRQEYPFTLQISGLSEGNYALHAGDKELGSFCAKELLEGIQLDRLPGLPCVEAAREVLDMEDQLTAIECTQIRDVAAARKYLENNRYEEKKKGTPLPDDDLTAAKQLLEKSTNGYHKNVYASFLKYGSVADRQAADAAILKLQEKIRARVQPWSVRITLSRK